MKVDTLLEILRKADPDAEVQVILEGEARLIDLKPNAMGEEASYSVGRVILYSNSKQDN